MLDFSKRHTSKIFEENEINFLNGLLTALLKIDRCCQMYNRKIDTMKKAKESDSVVQLNLKITNCNLFFIAENNRTYILIYSIYFQEFSNQNI